MKEPCGPESRKLPGAVRTHSDAGSAGSQPFIPAGGADRSEREGKDVHRLWEMHTRAGYAHRRYSVCRWPFFVVNFAMSTPYEGYVSARGVPDHHWKKLQ